MYLNIKVLTIKYLKTLLIAA